MDLHRLEVDELEFRSPYEVPPLDVETISKLLYEPPKFLELVGHKKPRFKKEKEKSKNIFSMLGFKKARGTWKRYYLYEGRKEGRVDLLFLIIEDYIWKRGEFVGVVKVYNTKEEKERMKLEALSEGALYCYISGLYPRIFLYNPRLKRKVETIKMDLNEAQHILHQTMAMLGEKCYAILLSSFDLLSTERKGRNAEIEGIRPMYV